MSRGMARQGWNILLKQSFGSQLFTRDGITVAKEVKPDAPQ